MPDDRITRRDNGLIDPWFVLPGIRLVIPFFEFDGDGWNRRLIEVRSRDVFSVEIRLEIIFMNRVDVIVIRPPDLDV